jgi:hypothetical protein
MDIIAGSQQETVISQQPFPQDAGSFPASVEHPFDPVD